LNKIKEKKLNSIKAEMEEIKKYIASSDSFNITNQNDYDYSNKNANDTLTLTKVLKQENKLFYNKDLDEIKKELIELKSSIDENKELLQEILLKIK
tara:strand:+ start:654 stop:941 length:288 start_codon:yes stop_codon:yes gene_type:complete